MGWESEAGLTSGIFQLKNCYLYLLKKIPLGVEFFRL